ncbi:hypothetical protein [Flavobacterium sp.]|uniref:hypothetical protein n=1 Tax=Flavobacterium sp. TaxID=239 RepID=UPI0037519901
MKTNYNIKRTCFPIIALLFLTLFSACQEDEVNSNGLSDENPIDASFTITPVSGVNNRYTLQSPQMNALALKWELGDGTSLHFGSNIENAFYPDAGNYTVSHTVVGKGGQQYTTSQNLIVPTSDPVSGNLIQGGKFKDATDHSKWTVLAISGTSTNWTFNSGSATIHGNSGGYDQQGIYQAVNVIAGKSYKIDMTVSGSGCQNTWFEVYVSPTPPVQNNDYNSLGRRIGLSTWDGCATSPFDGQLSVIKCVGSGNVVTFNTSQTVYFVIKSGGNNLGATGITVKNVEFRGI